MLHYFAFAGLICLLNRRRHFSIHQRNKVPGPAPSLLFGNMWDIYMHGHITMVERWHKLYGPVVGYFFGSIPLINCSDPEYLKNILVKDFQNFSDRSVRESKRLTDDQITDMASSALLAGSGTTSTALSFTTKLLLRFPEVQERLRNELLAATDRGTKFDFDRMQKCAYMEAVILEVLRMYPPLLFFEARHTAQDYEMGDFTIAKGVEVYVSVRSLHYYEEIFADPYSFQPDRFLPENRTLAMSLAHQPFGAGPRNCIGKIFAMMAMKTTLAKLLTKYELTSHREPRNNAKLIPSQSRIFQKLDGPLLCKLKEI
ncbi:cytochrome P450 3A31-like [Galendromus occidentalis]|uniref:Cytochrome P450 3A31-like n=1 Tax=Galendromus occidentalis TaxID=34638 RepID=A0AAJ7WHY3_9ACAR|nr:cytochrome P450 3A31-like [Galendromus occidentalis]